MLCKKTSIISYDSKQILSFVRLEFDWVSFFKIIVFLCHFRIRIIGLSAIPGSFNIVPFGDVFPGVEDIRHNYKVILPDHIPSMVFLCQFMQPEKFSDEGIRIFFYIIVVVPQNCSEMFILPIVNGLEHISSICRIIKKRSAFTLAREPCQGSYFPHHQRCH